MTVTCDTCGVAPKLPEWMRDWFSIPAAGKAWCPLHRHSVRVEIERARAAWEASQPQLFLEV